MIVLGLTGGIGMGKSTTAGLFAEKGVPVWDADAVVRALYAPGGKAVAPVLGAFPEAGSAAGGIDRQKLSQALVGDDAALARLEAVVHPLVRMDRDRFLSNHRNAGTPIVVLDVPLLLEKPGYQKIVDAVVLCSAPEAVRRERVMARRGMTPEKYDTIVSRQMPEAEKRRHADHVVLTGEGIALARRAVQSIVSRLSAGENPASR